jgi:exopolyphosphatase/guanosine-5'-triphosphate,3'-diphosphate pyrophosphatase
MRFASIDIGTNTVLLLVADVDHDGRIEPVEQLQQLPRLGRDVDAHQRIHPSAFDRIAWIVNEYKNLALQLRAERILVCATSAVRDASNKIEFLSYLKAATDLDVNVLTGEEEAIATYRGAISDEPKNSPPAAVLDIGGGSTEISYRKPLLSNGGSLLDYYSLQIGSVRLTERYFKHNPPLASELQSASQLIMEELSQVSNPGFGSYQLIGVAGTATTLASLNQGLKNFDRTKIHGYTIPRNNVTTWLQKLAGTTVEAIRSLSDTTEGRADILTAGVLILHEVMIHFGFQYFVVSERGLRYGLIVQEWERMQSSAR